MRTVLLCLALLPVFAAAAIKAGPVVYRDGDTVLEGYVAYDTTQTGRRPGVLVIHQWKGLGEYEKRRARMLAQMGYVAFCADVYGRGVRPKDAAEAGREAGKYRGNPELFRRRLRLALETLASQERTDRTRLAAIGYCFGGTGALELARSGAPLRAAVSFHGGLGTANPADAKNIKGSVLVLHGAVDPLVPPAQVAGFQKEMEDARVDYVFVAYGGAVHSFTEREAGNDPNSPARYDERADRRSWEAMRDFLRERFGR